MDVLDIGEVVERSGLPASTLRYYEQRGLIESTGRRGLRREFEAVTLERLAIISLGRAAGFSLDEIATMFDADGHLEIDRGALVTKADEIDRTIRRLAAVSEALRHAAACRAPSHLECPTFRGLMDPYDALDPAHNPMLGDSTFDGLGDQWSNGHFELLGHVTGDLELRGRHYTIDSYEGMDHSWGPRAEEGRRAVGWIPISFGEDFGMHVVMALEIRGGQVFHDAFRFGYVLDHGEVFGLVAERLADLGVEVVFRGVVVAGAGRGRLFRIAHADQPENVAEGARDECAVLGQRGLEFLRRQAHCPRQGRAQRRVAGQQVGLLVFAVLQHVLGAAQVAVSLHEPAGIVFGQQPGRGLGLQGFEQAALLQGRHAPAADQLR